VFIIQLYQAARRFLQRYDQVNALIQRERSCLESVAFHRAQYLLDANPENVHLVPTRFAIARFRRAHDELRMFDSGKDYWQLYDIDKMARRIRELDKKRSPDVALIWERIPSEAIPALYKRVTELRWAEERAAEKAWCDAHPRRSRQEELADFVRSVREANALAHEQRPAPV
jgi:hypothetical protein